MIANRCWAGGPRDAAIAATGKKRQKLLLLKMSFGHLVLTLRRCQRISFYPVSGKYPVC